MPLKYIDAITALDVDVASRDVVSVLFESFHRL